MLVISVLASPKMTPVRVEGALKNTVISERILFNCQTIYTKS